MEAGDDEEVVVEEEEEGERSGRKEENGSDKKLSENRLGFGFWKAEPGLGFSYSSRKPSLHMGQEGSEEGEIVTVTVRLHW